MFLNILTGDDKYSLLNRDNLRQHIQMQLPQKLKKFSELVFSFLKSRLRFESIQKKKKTLVADVFPKLRTRKYVLQYLSKTFRFRGHFDM